MKTIKVFWNGKRLRDVYPHASWFQVLKWKVRRLLRKAIIVSTVITAIYLTFLSGSVLFPQTVYSVQEREVVIEKEIEAPVLKRIAKCESNDSHYDKDGQVLMRGNAGSRASVDVGRYQINVMYWGKKATELGYNLMDEKDNEAMAKWLYANHGTEPWVHSKKCWQ